MKLKRSVRILKKVQVDGRWKFVSLKRNGKRYVWDERPGAYFLDWWDSGKRRRQFAWETASQALTAQKRKKNEVIGDLVTRTGEPAVRSQKLPKYSNHYGAIGSRRLDSANIGVSSAPWQRKVQTRMHRVSMATAEARVRDLEARAGQRDLTLEIPRFIVLRSH